MARTTGSDTLFQLIHSLTAEEKGYFKKFARRQLSGGNKYLRLFDAINAQKVFEEASLKKQFQGYADMKMYLKDIIADSLILYHRNGHAHLYLFTQIEKAIVFIIKGFYTEARKIFNDCLAESRRMELFSVTRYILHMLYDLDFVSINPNPDILAVLEAYKSEIEENLMSEKNLTEWEILHRTWIQKNRALDVWAKRPDVTEDIAELTSKETGSTRSRIKQLLTLQEAYAMEHKINETYKLLKEAVELSQRFRKERDASFNVVAAKGPMVGALIQLGRLDEVEEASNKMLQEEARYKLYHDVALVMGNFWKHFAYYETGQLKKAVTEILKTDKEMIMAMQRTNNHQRLRLYLYSKIVYFFMNRMYKETWLVIQELSDKWKKNIYLHDYPSILFMKMMVQLELENYDLLKMMATKAERKLKLASLDNFTYNIMIAFFKNVNRFNRKKEALSTWNLLIQRYAENKTVPVRAFAILSYSDWLETVYSGKSWENIIADSKKSRAGR